MVHGLAVIDANQNLVAGLEGGLVTTVPKSSGDFRFHSFQIVSSIWGLLFIRKYSSLKLFPIKDPGFMVYNTSGQEDLSYDELLN